MGDVSSIRASAIPCNLFVCLQTVLGFQNTNQLLMYPQGCVSMHLQFVKGS